MSSREIRVITVGRKYTHSWMESRTIWAAIAAFRFASQPEAESWDSVADISSLTSDNRYTTSLRSHTLQPQWIAKSSDQTPSSRSKIWLDRWGWWLVVWSYRVEYFRSFDRNILSSSSLCCCRFSLQGIRFWAPCNLWVSESFVCAMCKLDALCTHSWHTEDASDD